MPYLHKGEIQPLTNKMARAARMAAEGKSTQEIADELGVHRATVSRWLRRDDLKAMRNAALAEVVSAMIPRAYAVLNAQLENTNPWVAQGAARELIRLYNLQQGAADANVAVIFGHMGKPGAPGGAGGMLAESPPDDAIEVEFDA